MRRFTYYLSLSITLEHFQSVSINDTIIFSCSQVRKLTCKARVINLKKINKHLNSLVDHETNLIGHSYLYRFVNRLESMKQCLE